LALCEALINDVDDFVISFLKGIAGRNTRRWGAPSVAGATSAPIGRCRSLCACHRGPEAFLNLKVSLIPRFPFLGKGVASTLSFSAKHKLI